ncbi:hypothetical protein [Mycolicibacterium chubuense]|uniref:hypothetical protein n=1 Tax=Mycolicibacterium chubuense TaxID=1800 RepID=UPI0009D92AA2|nr:hypothetical protein [Mycolicibacterium chubuense]
MSDPVFVETADGGQVALPGHPNRRFLLRENADGSFLLQPAQVVTMAQYEYQSAPELRDLLAAAAASRPVRRTRRHRE